MKLIADHNQLNEFLIAGGIIVAFITAYIIFFYFIKRKARDREAFLPNVLQMYLYKAGLLLVVIGSATLIFPLFKNDISKSVYADTYHFLKILTIIACGYLGIKGLSAFREIAYRHYQQKSQGELKLRIVKTQFQLVQSILNFVIIFGTIAAVLITFPSIRNLGTTLLASAGVLGIVLGFAAQKSLGTFFAGLQIAVAQPIRIGDVVVVEGTFGTVGEINLTFVVLHAWDGRRLIVPISYFLEETFENWTRLSPEVVGKVTINVDYTIPVKEVRAEFMRLLGTTELWDRRSSGLLVTEADSRTIQLRATMSARNSGDAWDLECLIREELIGFIQKNYPGSLPRTRIN